MSKDSVWMVKTYILHGYAQVHACDEAISYLDPSSPSQTNELCCVHMTSCKMKQCTCAVHPQSTSILTGNLLVKFQLSF